jgi:signal transduction histidine kinase/ligand-binding sensor domain-containing protein
VVRRDIQAHERAEILPRGVLPLVAVVTLALALSAAAQSGPTGRDAPQRYGSEDGLPHNAVHALAQDRAGYLWVGTQNGLSRFDGEQFVTFGADAEDPRALASNFVTALLVDASDGLWVGTVAGLHRAAADGAFARVDLPAPPGRDPRVTDLAMGAGGRIWVGTDVGLYLVEPAAGFPAAPTVEALAGGAKGEGAARSIESLHEAPDGSIWALVAAPRRRLQRFHPDGRVREDYPAAAGLQDFLPDADGRVWIDHRGPVWPGVGFGAPPADAAARTAAAESELTPDTGDSYRAFARDPRDGVWIGTLSGVLHVAGGSVTRLSSGGGSRQLQDEVSSLLVDRDGDLWLGTYGGLLRWSAEPRGIRLLAGEAEGLTAVSTIAAADDGSVWAGTYGAGVKLVSLRDGAVRAWPDRPTGGATDGCSDYVWQMVRWNDEVWVATSDGICRIMSDGLQRFELPPRLGGHFMLLAATADGLMAATQSALYAIDPATSTVERLARLPMSPSALLAEPDGTIWLGTQLQDGTLLRVRGATVDRWPALAPAGIWDLHRDRRGTLWLATGEGLAAFNEADGTLRRSPAPAGGAVVYSIGEDDDGRLWIGTHRGLVAYAPDAAGGWLFAQYDGLSEVGNVEFNRHGATRLADGRLLLAGMHGITLIDPRHVRSIDAPAPALHEIRIAGRGRERVLHPRALGRVVLQPSDYAVTFELGAVDVANRWGGRYEYRLDRLEAEWVDGGARPAARYTTVPSGDYVFRARPVGGGAELRLGVTVLPPFWATWWFRAIGLGTLVALTAVAYRVRVRHLVAMEQMRLRIADDLHDELGSELSGIALMSGLMARREALPAGDREHLAEIESASRDVADGLRDIVWYTKPENDTLAALAVRIRALTSRLLAGIEHDIDLPGELDRSLDMRVRRDLYLSFKELLNNVVRHAQASYVSISLSVAGTSIELAVTDDGRGFDPTEPVAGNGLASLRRRARQLGAELEVDSAPGRGTRVRLSARTEDGREGR